MVSVLCSLIFAFELALVARALLSWFPLQPGGVMARVSGFLATVTEPVLAPVRRVLPRAGMLDLSFVVVLLTLEIVVRRLILGCTSV
jgi:YggT family protein